MSNVFGWMTRGDILLLNANTIDLGEKSNGKCSAAPPQNIFQHRHGACRGGVG